MFDTIAFADYSGSEKVTVQRKKIALAVVTRGGGGRFSLPTVRTRLTRDELRTSIDLLLVAETKVGRRVLFGFDHQYGLPRALQRPLRVPVVSHTAGSFRGRFSRLGT